MVAKKKATKVELHKWIVNASGQEIEVQAEEMGVVQGALIFFMGGITVRAWAEGSWSTVAAIVPTPGDL